MKRSEIIEIIEIHLKNIIEDSLIEGYLPTKEQLNFDSSLLLMDLEEKGLLPPLIIKKDPGHFPGDSFEYQINEWEPEET